MRFTRKAAVGPDGNSLYGIGYVRLWRRHPARQRPHQLQGRTAPPYPAPRRNRPGQSLGRREDLRGRWKTGSAAAADQNRDQPQRSSEHVRAALSASSKRSSPRRPKTPCGHAATPWSGMATSRQKSSSKARADSRHPGRCTRSTRAFTAGPRSSATCMGSTLCPPRSRSRSNCGPRRRAHTGFSSRPASRGSSVPGLCHRAVAEARP